MPKEPEPEVLDESPIEDEEESEETPEEDLTEEPEDPKEVARAMLLAGEDPNKVAKETGLPRRVIWGIKGALAKSRKIKTKKQKKREQQIEQEEEEPPEEEEEEYGEAPFRREKTAEQLIVEICEKYGVKARATKIIADRSRRVPGGVLHPSDFERLLMDLDSGIKKRRRAELVVEEYELALRQQRELEREGYGDDYYPRRESYSRRASYYPERSERQRYPERYERESYPQYDPYGRRLPERESEPSGVSYEDFESFKGDLLETLRKEKEEDKIDKLFNTITKQNEELTKFSMELKNLKENPPAVKEAPKGESEYEKSLKHTIERQDKKHEELIDLIKTERSESKSDLENLRKANKENIEELRKFYKEKIEEVKEEAEERAKLKTRTEGYTQDEIRLLAETSERLADVAEKRRPLKELATILREGTPQQPPERERVGGKSNIAKLVGPEFQE